ncbi:thiamine phosphate synthase [Paenibacillus filicis]|uniref:Thiamine phosphate synthase n=1 Tax=Paenibacillus gyeongsangnamensis TaxID=3388067 RepID=A0ABT4Q553_9BACL|nr:thiamine phosphate synthase [Paenibacillus filicis]MCZ8511999.1 thiamine phosphate synthase [Paenibacillus filicis]
MGVIETVRRQKSTRMETVHAFPGNRRGAEQDEGGTKVRSEQELHVITTGRQELDEVASILESCSTALIHTLHVREKHRSAWELVQWHARLKPLLPQTAVVVNDRVDAAMAAGADGVQLAWSSLTPAQARHIVPGGMRIGCSVHSAAEASEAARQGADYVLFGHVFASGSKPGLEPRGLAALTETVQASPVPVIAIGGIVPENAEDVLATGCAGFAVLSSFFLSPDPQGQLAAFQEAITRFNRNRDALSRR